MPTTQLTHNQNRSKVCLICFIKGNSMSVISGITLKRVQEFFLTSFDPFDQTIPNGICGNFRRILGDIERIKLKNPTTPLDLRRLQDPIDFSKLDIPVITRSSGVLSLNELKDCPCLICKVATENAVSSVSRSAGKGFAKAKHVLTLM